MNIDLSKVRANASNPPSQVHDKQPLVDTTPENSNIQVQAKVEPEVEEPKLPEKIFQTYRSGLENQKVIMKCGRTLYIRQHKYITAKQDEIDFLDEEISLGFPGLKKGEPVTETDLDPMAALKKKMRAEIMKEIDAGSSDVQKVVPASTQDLADLAGNSNSAPE